MRTLALFFLCCWDAAHAQPLQVGSRAMAWNASFAELGSVTSDWAKGAIQMPCVESEEARINEALYMRQMGVPPPLKAGKTFALADGAESPSSTASQEVTVTRNDGRILSIQFTREGCGAYYETYDETVSCDAATGRTLTIE